MSTIRTAAVGAVAFFTAACAGGGGGAGGASSGQGALSSGGAAFTTYDVGRGGCVDGGQTNCNGYAAKDDVFLSGGPATAALPDGVWTFRVVAPGSQASVVDGAAGNLSDVDAEACRTFTMSGGRIDVAASTFACAHAFGTGPDGQPVLQLSPFDDTPNDGGEYVLGLCPAGAVDPSGCKFDAFHVVADGAAGPSNPPADPVFRGLAYYDANANGQFDPGEAGLSGWQVNVGGDHPTTLVTAADGTFELSLAAGHATFAESAGGGSWTESGNTVDQTSVTGGATATLEPDLTYAADAPAGSEVDGLYFGDVCLGAGGGSGLGYWANAGARLVTADDLAGLDALPLVNQDGTPFDPTSAASLSAWLLQGEAPNMAWMLSVQLAALWLSVEHGDVAGAALVLAPGATSGNSRGFTTVDALLAEAEAELAADPLCLAGDAGRSYEEALKDDIEAANQNGSFVQADPSSCAPPVFP